MTARIYKTRRAIFRVERTEDGKLDLYREYFSTKKMDAWQHDGRKYDKAGLLIASAGGIGAFLSLCEDVEDIEQTVKELNAVKEATRLAAKLAAMKQAQRQKEAAENDFRQHFEGKEVTETNAVTVYTLLRYLNTQNWGTWALPKMDIGYSCHQYNCEGRTATTIKLDKPIKVAGRYGTMFQYGAPFGHLTGYERIVDWD